MKKDKYIIVAVIVLIVLNLTSWGLYWHTKTDRPLPPPQQENPDIVRSERFLLRRLNFSENQEQQLEVLQSHHFEKMHRLNERHRRLREAYVRMAMGPDYDTAEADSLFREMTQINGEMQKSTWLHFRDIYQLCNKKQKKEFRRLMLRLNRLKNRNNRPSQPPGHP